MINFNFDSNRYYTFKNMPKRIFPAPHSLPNNVENIGVTNVRGSEEIFSEFGNPFRANRATDNSDLDSDHGINLNINFNEIPFRIIDIEPDYPNMSDIWVTAAFLFLDEGKEIEHHFILDNDIYLNCVEEYNFENEP